MTDTDNAELTKGETEVSQAAFAGAGSVEADADAVIGTVSGAAPWA